MAWLFNACYLFGLLLLSPWLAFKALTTGKYRRGLRDKLFGLSVKPPGLSGTTGTSRPPIWFHGVSVGEIHLLRQVVASFRRRKPDIPIVISTTTDTGYDEARRCFPDLVVMYYPFDFSWAVRGTMGAIAPCGIVLAESELWPNFLLIAQERGVPVAVINGRMSPRSFQRWGRLKFIASWLLRRVDLLAVQTEEYARNVIGLGADPAKVHVTGSVKYDGATTDRNNPKTNELRSLFDIGPRDLVWIAGSTQAPEEEFVLGIFQRLKTSYPHLRLFLVPRQKDRFDEVARLIERNIGPFRRRSVIPAGSCAPRFAVVLMDTIGELSALWGLADVAFVGGSMDGVRGGQNMIEPAAYGAAVVFGPHVWNFKDAANRLLDADAACQVRDAAELETVVRRLLDDRDERQRRGEAAQKFVLEQQGATQRTLDLLDRLLREKSGKVRAA